MINTTAPSSRKKFLFLGAAAFCTATFARFFTRKNKPAVETVKMLTEDGTLVEIDKSLLPSNGKKISNTELKEWIRK